MSGVPTTETPVDAASDPLWMTTRPLVGDVQLRWEDLTEAEQRNAIARHNQMYGIKT